MIPLWFVYAFATTLFWGVGYVLVKHSFKGVTSLWTNIIANFLTLIFWALPVLYLTHFQIPTISFKDLFIILVINICYMTFPYVVSKGQISLTGAVFSSYPIFVIILSSLFLHERLSMVQIVGIASALIGSILVSLPSKKLTIKSSSWVGWAIGGALISGIGDFFVKISSNNIGAYANIFYMAIFFNLLSFPNYYLDKGGRKKPKISIKVLGPAFLAWSFLLTGGLFFLLAFGVGPASLVSPVSATYPALVAILAVLFLKEKLTQIHAIGIIGIVLGVMIIGLASH